MDGEKPRRAARPEVLISREARRLIGPFHMQIHVWQLETARLIGLGSRMRRRNQRRGGFLGDALALSQVVHAAQRSFDALAAGLPRDLAGSARIVDTRRSLASVAEGLSRAIELISTPEQ